MTRCSIWTAPHGPGAVGGGRAAGADRSGTALALGEPCLISGAAVGEEVGSGPCHPRQSRPGAGDSPTVEVYVEVVTAEAVGLAELAVGVDRQWPGDRDLVVPTACSRWTREVYQPSAKCSAGSDPRPQPGVDAGQSLRVVAGGVGGGHVRDHVDAVGPGRRLRTGRCTRPGGRRPPRRLRPLRGPHASLRHPQPGAGD